MPVTNVQLKTIEARRFQDPSGGQLRVDHNSHLSLVHKDSEDRLRVDFTFTTGYGALGVIKLEGQLWVQEPGVGAQAEEWAKTQQLPEATAHMVHSAILGNCVPDAVGFAKAIRLPPPIPLPQVQVGKKPAAKPADGPETA